MIIKGSVNCLIVVFLPIFYPFDYGVHISADSFKYCSLFREIFQLFEGLHVLLKQYSM